MSLAFSPDGETLASASDDGTVRLWGTTTGDSQRVLQGHTSSVRSVAFTPDGKTLYLSDGNNGEGQPYHRVRKLTLP